MDDTEGSRRGVWYEALRKRDFRLFWLGQCVSLVGTWMQNVGQSWLVLELTGSPLKLGTVSALQFLPMMLLAVFAGPLVDRLPKRRILLATQSALMASALVLALLVATGAVRYWMILALALWNGLVNTLDMPTRQAYVIEIAGRESLMNAVSLNSAAFNAARILGPSVAGFLIGAIGIAPCFFLNALSFLAVIAALLAIRARPAPSGEGPARRGPREILESAREGLGYVRDRPGLLYPLLRLALLSTVVINYNILVPTFSRGPLGLDAAGYGIMMTCLGVGSLGAALVLAARSGRGGKPSEGRLVAGAAGMCLALAAAGAQRSPVLTGILLAALGFSTVTLSAQTNAAVQLRSDDAHRGRVMSLYALVFGGVTPIGAMYAGAFVDAAGPAACMMASGALGLAATVGITLASRRAARP